MNQTNFVFGKRQNVQNLPANPLLSNMATRVNPTVYTGPERRKTPRRKMLKTCKIVFNNRFSVFDGVMVNRSEGGARLKVLNPASVAPEFLLSTVFGNAEYECVIRWRDQNYIGVEFENF